MITTSKIHDIEAVEITEEDIAELLASDASGVCRAILTPKAAALLLNEHNARNRGLKRYQKEFIRRQIDESKFAYNGEAIVVGDDGNVMNGQHRLAACVAAGIPIEVLLVFGIPSRLFVTLDQGSRRTGADVLTIEGFKSTTSLAACLRQIDNYFHERLGEGRCAGRQADNGTVLDLIKKYPDAQRSVSKMLHCRLSTPAMAAALHYLFSLVDVSQADEFCGVILDGVKPDVAYSDIGKAASMLREWLMRAAISAKKTPQKYIANVWIKAWNAGRTGNFPKVLMYKDSEGQVLIK